MAEEKDLKNKEITLEELTDFMISLHPEGKAGHERDERFMTLISPYLHMTEEEMQIAIPHGCYEISGNGYVAMTGKGGLILTILEMQKQFKAISQSFSEQKFKHPMNYKRIPRKLKKKRGR